MSGRRATISAPRWSLDRSAPRPPAASRELEPPLRPVGPLPRAGLPTGPPSEPSRRHRSGAARGPRGAKRSRPDGSAPRSGSGRPCCPHALPGPAPAAVTRAQAELLLVELCVARCPSCWRRGKFWLRKITRADTRKVPGRAARGVSRGLSQGGQGSRSAALSEPPSRSASRDGCAPGCPEGTGRKPGLRDRRGLPAECSGHTAAFWKARGAEVTHVCTGVRPPSPPSLGKLLPKTPGSQVNARGGAGASQVLRAAHAAARPPARSAGAAPLSSLPRTGTPLGPSVCHACVPGVTRTPGKPRSPEQAPEGATRGRHARLGSGRSRRPD